MIKHKIIFADDDNDLRSTISAVLNVNDIMPLEVYEAANGNEIFDILEKEPDISCIVLDYDFEKYGGKGQKNGLEIAEELRKNAPYIPIIMTSEVDDKSRIALQAGQNQIIDFFDKPFGEIDLILRIEKIVQSDYSSNGSISEKIKTEFNSIGFESTAKSMRAIQTLIYKASRSDSNVLLLGETGVGKTTIAKYIHNLGKKTKNQFKDFSCAQFAPGILESELFGHVKGAFNNAREKKGILDVVKNGTLFLDEFAELPLERQNRFLYLLGEQKKYSPVGAPDIIKNFSGRIIAASNKAINDNNWRKDIVGRFNYVIEIPPLRERLDDIPFFVNHFLKKVNRKKDREISIESNAIVLMQRQSWTGNLHQLKRVVENCHDGAEIEDRNKILTSDVQKELLTEYGIYSNINNNLESQLVNHILDNKDMILDKLNIDKSGGIKALTFDFNRELILECLRRNNNVYRKAAKFIRENKDTFRYFADKLNIINPE